MTVPNFPGVQRLTTGDWAELERIAKAVGTLPNCLAAVMSAESGFRPDIWNKRKTHVGLIQFAKATAKSLGTTREKLAKMSFADQLEYVRRFYLRVPPVYNLEDCGNLHLATFYPKALPWDDSDVIAKKGQPVYDQNAPLDTNKDGTITAGEIRALPGKRIAAAEKKQVNLREGGKTPAPKGAALGAETGLVVAVAVVAVAWLLLRKSK